jgi:hypothetical protein
LQDIDINERIEQQGAAEERHVLREDEIAFPASDQWLMMALGTDSPQRASDVNPQKCPLGRALYVRPAVFRSVFQGYFRQHCCGLLQTP